MPDPVETGDELVEEMERGGSERTPWLVWGTMHLVVGALVLVVLAVAVAAYLLA